MFGANPRSYTDQANEHDILQLMRGFGILLVVLQHAFILYLDSDAALTFVNICVFIDVHVFMFVSGYLFQKNSEKYREMGMLQFTKKKFNSLMVPYLFWESVLYFGTFFLYLLSDWYGVNVVDELGFQRLSLSDIFVSFLTYRYSYIELYWFLFALFWVFVINYSFLKFSHRIEFIVICSLLFAILSMYLKSDNYILTKMGRSILTFGFGRLFQKYRLERVFIKNWILLIISLISFDYLFCVYVEIRNTPLRIIYKNYKISLIGILGILIFFIISTFLASYPFKLTKAIIILGNYSLPIYLLHNPWIVHTSNMVAKMLSVPDEIGVVASTVLGIAVPILLYKYVIKKNALISRITLGI